MLNELLNCLVTVACGLTLFATAFVVLYSAHSLEISIRTIAALMIGAAGAWYIARALNGWQLRDEGPEGWLLLGVTLWIWEARYQRRGQPMRRASDLRDIEQIVAATPKPERGAPWLPPRR